MKRLVPTLSLVAVLLPAALLADAQFPQCAPAGGKATPDFAPAGQLPLSAGDHLFLDAGAYAGDSDLELRYFLDGQLHLTEVLPLGSLAVTSRPAEKGPAPRTVVELLAMRPAERKLLAEIARRRPERLQVEIRQGGTLLRAIPFEQLREESAALLEEPFRPEVVQSTVSGKGRRDGPPLRSMRAPGLDSVVAPISPCEQGCMDERDACYATTCPTVYFCDECDVPYLQCMESCQPPPPPTTCQYKEEYYWTGLYYVGTNVYWWDQICFPDQVWYYYDGLWHVRIEMVYRRDRIKKTTYTDCSVTQQVVGYEYWFFPCYDWTGSSCDYPWYPYNTCY